MNWLMSFLVGVLSGILGVAVAGCVASVCSGWLNVSNREGAVGYLIVFVALCGGVLGFVLGLGVSRWVAILPEPGFLKALAISCGAVFSLGAISLLLGWLSADFTPQIDGRSLALDIEVRCPEAFSCPTEQDVYGAYACVNVPGRLRESSHCGDSINNVSAVNHFECSHASRRTVCPSVTNFLSDRN